MSATVSLSASAGHVSRVKIASELRLTSTATVSLGHAMFVPREVGHPKNLKLKTIWKITDHLTASYTKLDMGDGATMCVFAGSVTASNPQGHTVPIATIDSKCIADYRGRAWFVPANVRVAGQQQWFSNEPGKPTGSEFQLTLVNGSTLALWQKNKLGSNQEVTVVLDGLVFSGGPRLPAGCRRSQAVGANSTCRGSCKPKHGALIQHEASLAKCLVLPGSMNGGKHPRGCPGAVWSNGKPAGSYCSGKGGKYPWWRDCCQWKDGSCKPKSVAMHQDLVASWSQKCKYKKCAACDECAMGCDVTKTQDLQPIETAASGTPHQTPHPLTTICWQGIQKTQLLA